MTEPRKTIIQIEVTHGTGPSVEPTEKDKTYLAETALETYGEFDWWGDYPAYKITVNGQEFLFNRENDYRSDSRDD